MIKANTALQMNLEGIDPLGDRQFTVRKRNGDLVPFEEIRIYRAIEKAFKVELGIPNDEPVTRKVVNQIQDITDSVVKNVLARDLKGEGLRVEGIQDEVETQLMKGGYFSIARRYIVYREEHRKARLLKEQVERVAEDELVLYITNPSDGSKEKLDPDRIRGEVGHSCHGLENRCHSQIISEEVFRTLYDGITPDEINKALILAAKAHIEKEPAYTYVTARLLLKIIYKEVLQKTYTPLELEMIHRKHFRTYIHLGVEHERLSPELLQYDLDKLSSALQLSRDLKFCYMGLQTLYDRYLLHLNGRRVETPQYFWMRVAMGLAVNEGTQKEDRAIEFYTALSSFYFTSSTPTLFNAGTLHPQLSSCYLSTVMDNLEHIFKVISDDAKLSKWAGGLGNDWTNVRATGAYIKGTNGKSQGVIPFLKVANDTAVAVNQGGKRKGAMCAYLETWHLDIEDFLELRKNTGDERRRTHDMNTSNWIPDLFMKRVIEEKQWTLFSPAETPDLHDSYGAAFEKRYKQYEKMADKGVIKQFKRIDAVALWRKMLSMLYETGHPWITFKDPSNIRSPQSHAGVVHSSNLCTEILLNTSKDETAVCNLGSINLAAHTTDKGLNERLLAKTVRTAMRMLDNVIDINFYPTSEAKNANLRHRPVGLGLMGFQDALYKLNISYASEEAVSFADRSMEMISYYAILASSELAKEKGAYSSYEGSKWSKGYLPIDTLALLEKERNGYVDINRDSSMDWRIVRESISKNGMRNSNTMAIAPTATISNITGIIQSIEPAYKNLFVKSNLSGEFTVINHHLVQDLKDLGLWDPEMIDDFKYYDGSIQEIVRIPDRIKHKYLTAFEIDQKWLIKCASRRQKWIDMGQSLNLYMAEPNGRVLSDMYQFAWRKGLKTTYYLRSLGATQVEKSTLDVNRRGIQPRWMKNKSASSKIIVQRSRQADTTQSTCSILDPDCEACQ